MKGTRPLDNDEIRRVSAAFTGTFEVRNRGLFMLGVSTGGRISELLSLTIDDVYQNGKAVSDLLYNRSIVKGGEVSRAMPVNIDGRDAIEDLIDWHREKYGTIAPSFVPISKQERIRRYEPAIGTRDAKKGVCRCRLERQTRDTQPTQKLCAAAL